MYHTESAQEPSPHNHDAFPAKDAFVGNEFSRRSFPNDFGVDDFRVPQVSIPPPQQTKKIAVKKNGQLNMLTASTAPDLGKLLLCEEKGLKHYLLS